MKKIYFKDLLKFTSKILIKVGLDIESAKNLSYCLCETSLRGVDSI